MATDHINESKTLCGIHIHTHPKTLMIRDIYSPPSGQDIYVNIQRLVNKFDKYDYVFDGKGLWFYKPNKALKNEFFKLLNNNPERLDLLLEIASENANNNAVDLMGKRIYFGFFKQL